MRHALKLIMSLITRPLPDKSSSQITTLLTILFFITTCSIAAQTSESTSIPADSVASTDNTPRPVYSISATDVPDDAGGAIDITWEVSPDDVPNGKVQAYRIFRSASVGGSPSEFTQIGEVNAGSTTFRDGRAVEDADAFYQVVAVNFQNDNGIVLWSAVSSPALVGPVHATAQWFNTRRVNAFIGVILLSGIIIFLINQAKSGKNLYIRKIAGLEAVDEAVGRATEMGKKILFIPGIQDMNDVQTIAGIAVLGHVAELAAEYEAKLEVPVCKSLVMVTARETMKEAYAKAGRSDAFQDSQVSFITEDQFGYAAAVEGQIVREKPATIFYQGAFFAESLLLAEVGNAEGCIQIAGTGEPAQLPFFVAACDYTLIGEELFAASAYMSHEPRQLGSLKGQDVGKAVFLVAIVVGIICATFGWANLGRFFQVN
jgi:hypothetical protein